jgi:uncharacterized protein (DUF952 family)
MRLVFKICTVQEWQEASRTGRFLGSPDDLRDGFIHLSAARQLRDTAAKHFSGMDNLLLIAFAEDQLGARLKWETSRGGDLFPHHYGPLPVGLAKWLRPLPWRDGRHGFPDEIGA